MTSPRQVKLISGGFLSSREGEIVDSSTVAVDEGDRALSLKAS